MKILHWIIFSIGVSLLFLPTVGDDLVALFVPHLELTREAYLHLIRWDDFFLGLTVLVLALVVLTAEAGSHKTPGLKAMHWLQVLLGAFVAFAPFVFTGDSTSVLWTHYTAGMYIAVFALLQIYYEPK